LLGDWFPQDRQNAGLQAAIFTIGATFARPVGGWLADQLGGARVLIWVFAFVVLTRLVLAWQAGNANMVIITDLLLALGVGLGFGNGAIFKLVAQYFPKNTGLVAGLVGAAGGLGGFFPPLIMGAVKDHTGSYAIGFLILAAMGAFCLVLLLASPQKLPAGEPARGSEDGRPGADGRAVALAGEDSDVFGRLVNFLLYREPVGQGSRVMADSADHLDRAKNDARSIMAILEGRDVEDVGRR
jgi:MFS family permease